MNCVFPSICRSTLHNSYSATTQHDRTSPASHVAPASTYTVSGATNVCTAVQVNISAFVCISTRTLKSTDLSCNPHRRLYSGRELTGSEPLSVTSGPPVRMHAFTPSPSYPSLHYTGKTNPSCCGLRQHTPPATTTKHALTTTICTGAVVIDIFAVPCR